MVKILVCDDQEVVCQGLRAILSTDNTINVVGIANNGAEAIDILEKKAVDLILMDLKMPIINGIQVTKMIKETHPRIKILVLSTYEQMPG